MTSDIKIARSDDVEIGLLWRPVLQESSSSPTSVLTNPNSAREDHWANKADKDAKGVLLSLFVAPEENE